jgi:hypothetical protein
MPRVTFVKSARKDNPVAKKGESYYWWKFRYGGKRYSKTRPRPSQLTQSAYYSQVRSLVEQIEDFSTSSYEDIQGLKEDIINELENLRDETQGSLDNMPDQLQYSPTGELLQERVDALDSAISELDMIDEEWEFDEDEPERDEFDEDEDGDIEFQDAKAEWNQNREEAEQEAISVALSDMMDYVSEAEV